MIGLIWGSIENFYDVKSEESNQLAARAFTLKLSLDGFLLT